jgi:hypothetical protein
LAIEEQVRAYGGPQFQVIQQVMERFSTAIQTAGIDIVPKVVMGGNGGASGSSSALEGLLALLLSDKLGIDVTSDGHANGNGTAPISPEITRLRESILQGLSKPPMELPAAKTKQT